MPTSGQYTIDDIATATPTNESSQPSSTAAPTTGQYKLDDIDISQPSIAARFTGSAVESSSGLPADITKWPEAIQSIIKSMTNDPFTGKPATGRGPGGILNVPANIVKNIGAGSAAASQKGIDQLKQPGIVNKVVGPLKYVIGGLPIVGPSIVRSMEEAENGNYAGMLGTLSGMGLQAAMANPEATAARVDAAGKYLFSKPRVQETILAGEAKEMLDQAEAAARAKGHAMFPDSDASLPGPAVSNIANKAINEHIAGTPETPGPLKSMTSEDALKRIGAIERVGGGLQDIFAKMSSNDPVTMKDAHGYYTELGRYGARDLPGDVYAAVKQTRDDLGELIGDQYKSEGKLGQWEDAKSYWSDLHKHWWDTDSPLYKARNAADPTAILKPLTGDSAERAASYLQRYTNEGANPKIVKAASTFYKGMDQMRIRGLYQASGGLLLAMMLRQAGAPGAEVAGGIGSLLAARLGMGYFRTRPSLTSLLSDDIKPSTWRSFPLKDNTNIKGNPSPFGPVGGPEPPAPAGEPSPTVGPVATVIPPVNPIGSIDHSASTLTPTESTFLSAIKDHPTINPELREDIKAATEPSTDIKASDIHDPNRIKGTMAIMKAQKVGYGAASKIYDQINGGKGL